MKNYCIKKNIIIVVLSFIIVLLVGGLWVYMDSVDSSEPAIAADENTEEQTADVDEPENQTSADNTQGTQGTKDSGTEENAAGEDRATESETSDNGADNSGTPEDEAGETPTNESEAEESEIKITIDMPSATGSGTTGQTKPSDDKPKTAAEATPPATEAPAEDEHDISNAADTNIMPDNRPIPAVTEDIPKSGDTNDNGEIYIPGFGWVENEGGGVEVIEGDYELSGELVGDM